VAAALALVAAVCASRVLLGVHFLSDVVVGFVLGLAWLTLVTAAFEAWRHARGEPFPGDPLRHGVEPAEQEQLAAGEGMR
jgi:undecaprenyl-diphosphatase